MPAPTMPFMENQRNWDLYQERLTGTFYKDLGDMFNVSACRARQINLRCKRIVSFHIEKYRKEALLNNADWSN